MVLIFGCQVYPDEWGLSLIIPKCAICASEVSCDAASGATHCQQPTHAETWYRCAMHCEHGASGYMALLFDIAWLNFALDHNLAIRLPRPNQYDYKTRIEILCWGAVPESKHLQCWLQFVQKRKNILEPWSECQPELESVHC